MNEPVANEVHGVVPGVFRWGVWREGRELQAYAVGDEDRCVLVDPLPLTEEALRSMGRVEAILLTGTSRQGVAWRWRQQLGASVYAPDGLPLDEAPDLAYGGGEALPGGLVAFHTPGPTESSQVLWLTTGPRGVVFLDGLLAHREGRLVFPEELQDPPRARTSVGRILERLPVDVLCFHEGLPIVGEGARVLRHLLAQEEAGAQAPV